MNEIILINQETVNAVALFADSEKLHATLEDLKQKVMAFVPDTSTASGRKDIASIAYKIAQSKQWLIGEGKKLTIQWREQTKKVNEECNKIEAFLNDLKEQVREPLTAWEIAEEARIKAEALAVQIEKDWDEAIKDNEIFDMKAEIARRDAEAARIEAEKLAKIEAQRLEAERIELEKQAEIARIEREKRIAEEAKVKAEREAEARIKAEQEKAKRELEAAEAKRLADIREAELKAEAEKQAIIKAQLEKERIEAERLAEEKRIAEAERIAEEKRIANKKHREKIKSDAVRSLVKIGILESDAVKIITEIVNGNITHVTINF